MTFSIKKAEHAAIAAVLNDETYATEDDMVKALIKTMVEELAKRETVMYVQRDGVFDFFWPFWYEKDARAFHERHPPLKGAHGGIFTVRSPYVDDQLSLKHQAEIAKRMEGLNWPTEASS